MSPKRAKFKLVPTFKKGQRVMIATETSAYFGLIGIVESKDHASGNYLVGFTARQLAKTKNPRLMARLEAVVFWPCELEAL